MENKKSISFTFSVVAIILGVTLFKQFDFQNLKFEHTGLAVVYGIGFAIAVYILVNTARNK